LSLPAHVWAIKQPVWNASERAVLAVLADFANTRGEAWPAFDTIAELCGMSRRGVIYTVKRLVARELIAICHGKRGRFYLLAMGADATAARQHDEPDATPAPPGATAAPEQCSGCTQSSQEPVKKPSDAGAQKGDRADGRKEKLGAAQPVRRGTRLSDDWQPSAEEIAWAREHEPEVDWRREADKFRDYWLGKPGHGAVKLDWSATWRNWLRNARRFGGSGAREAVRPPFGLHDDGEPWAQRLEGFAEKRFWIRQWGPPPDAEGCRAPAELLRRCGYGTELAPSQQERFAVSPDREPI